MSSCSGRRGSFLAGRFAGLGLAAVAATFAIAPLGAASASAATASRATVSVEFGTQLIRIGVQIKEGAYVPAGTTTANTEATITETGPLAPDPGVSTCNTDGGTTEIGGTATYCTFQRLSRNAAAADAPLDQLYAAQPGDTVTVTQTTVNDNLLIDSSTNTFDPCTLTPDDLNGVCSAQQTALFNDPGIPPTTDADNGTLKSGGTIVIDVTANDSSNGAPSTIAIDTPPAHGTATPIATASAAAHARGAAGVVASSIRYTPNTGFSGDDTFTYTMATANGSSTASVFLTVSAPQLTLPDAVNDSVTTVSGRPVTIHVQRNDVPNGGGALHLTSVGKPGHGTATIDGTSIVYRSASGFTGVDHFTYTSANSGGKASAQVTVTVTAPTVTPGSPVPTLPNTGAPIVSTIADALVLITGGSLLAEIGRRQRRGCKPESGG